MKQVEFLYFDGCPSSQAALSNLRSVLDEQELSVDLKTVLVNSPDEAEEAGFQGSPSIRIDGRDIEGREEGFSFNCRLYAIAGKLTGIPTVDYLREKIKVFQ